MHNSAMRKRVRQAGYAAAIAALTLSMAPVHGLGIAQAQSRQPQNVFEALFPQLIDERLRREQARRVEQQQVQQAQAAPIEKVRGPQYYRYKAGKLARIDLASLGVARRETTGTVEAVQPAPADPLLARVEQVVLSDGSQSPAVEVISPADRLTAEVEAARLVAFSKVAGQFSALSLMAEPEIASAILAWYRDNPRLLWLTNSLEPSNRARNAQAVLREADRWGLDPAEYAVEIPVLSSDASEETRAAAAARFEIAMTARALRYMSDAEFGRIDPNLISGYHDFPKRKRDHAAMLERLAGGLPSRILTASHPANSAFLALKAELAALEHQRDDEIVIPENTLIKPGETHEQVPHVIRAIGRRGSEQLRSSFAALLATDAPPQTSFTPEVVELVKAFQKEAGLGADGVVGRNTIGKLSGFGVEAKRERVIIALEQLRWHPRELGSRHVFINVPAFRARYINGGSTQIDMRVVVGTKANQTSFFHDQIETVEYNPYWGVPQSILVNEYLPKLRENPAYLDERGYEVTDNKGNRIPSSAVDWWSMSNSVPYNVRQSPGEANALGELKILFPNKHAIYMHDTPAKSLFSRDQRAYSHGCVRLAEPRKMAAAVLGKDVGHVEAMLSRGHGQDELKQPFPVYVAYFTAWPTDAGVVEYFADVYGRDDAVAKAFAAVATERAVTG